MKINPRSYYTIFQENEEGRDILTELATLYYDRQSFDKDNQYLTAFNEGARSVITFIMQKTAQAKQYPTISEEE